MRKRSILIAILAVAAFATGTHAQNLVINPGFDQYSTATDLDWLFGGDMFKSFGVKGWTQSTTGSSDFFFQTSTTGAKNVPPYAGDHAPASGNAFAGFIHWVPGREYREYLTGELLHPLEKGKKYLFRMKICTGARGSYMVNDLGVYFSAARFSDTTQFTLKQRPQVWLDASLMQQDPEQWTVIENVFIASGDEKYFTVGNFCEDSATTVVKRATTLPRVEFAYYYADDIAVEPTTADPVAPGKPTALADQVIAGNTFIARGINFDLDKSTLRPESYLQLHEIVAELKRKPTLQVEVRGYTDSTGNEPHNLQLSKARAKVVADYLISAGIDKSRITWRGCGSADPVSLTQPVLNRRVEFVFR
jgi:outer membrane protein OmpA-like peptidoglycan-associated protein